MRGDIAFILLIMLLAFCGGIFGGASINYILEKEKIESVKTLYKDVNSLIEKYDTDNRQDTPIKK